MKLAARIVLILLLSCTTVYAGWKTYKFNNDYPDILDEYDCEVVAGEIQMLATGKRFWRVVSDDGRYEVNTFDTVSSTGVKTVLLKNQDAVFDGMTAPPKFRIPGFTTATTTIVKTVNNTMVVGGSGGSSTSNPGVILVPSGSSGGGGVIVVK